MLRTAFLLATLAITFTLPQASASSGWLHYKNLNYGYAVLVPARLKITTNPSPSPQHGFQIILGQGRSISVDASFDSTFLGSAESAVQDRAADDGISGQIGPAKHPMQGLDAERIQALVNGKRIDLAVAYRPNGNDVAIIYTFELDTDATHQARDEMFFNEVLSGFSLLNFP